jgi:YbbR domain-containing protein
MKDFLRSNLFYRLSSVVLAIFLMFYVHSLENPNSEKTFYSINIAFNNQPSDLILSGEPKTVDIRIKGTRNLVNNTSSKDIKAWVDLAEAKAGKSVYKVQYSMPEGVEIAWIKPGTMELYLDEIGSKTVALKYTTANAVESGFGNFEPVVEPAQVQVSGPKLLLEKISHAVVNIDLTGLKTNFEGELPIQLVDQDGNPVQDAMISLSQDKAKVQVAVTENMSSKSVPVRPALSGEIQKNWMVSSVEVVPTAVRITGSFDIIKDIEYLTTQPLDLTQLTESFSGKLALVVPEGVGVLDGTEVQVNVTVTENLATHTINGVPVEVRNGPADRSYGTLPTTVDVELQAYPWIFANASSAGGYNIAVKAYVDLEGQAAGTKEYTVKAECPSDYKVVSISPDTVRVHQ